MPNIPNRNVDLDADPFATELIATGVTPVQAAPAAQAGSAAAPNPLLSEADALLALVPQLRSTAQVADVGRLRSRVVAHLEQFDQRVRARGLSASQCQKAHFVLCLLFDEVVESMPWGAGGQWQPLNPLKSAAPLPTEGGLQQLALIGEDAGTNRDLRELIYVSLALGFITQGRAAPGAQAEQVRARLAALLEPEPGAPKPPMSVRWRPAVGRANAVASWLPLWVGSFIVAGLLAALYFALAIALSTQSDKVFAQIATLRFPATAAPPPPSPSSTPRLLQMLGAAGEALQVRDEIDRSVVRLRDDHLFEASSANLTRSGAELLRPVAAALQQTPGQIQIIGHTDSNAARSARFPSNWELSVERARVVRDALEGFGISASRLRYDGRADTEPLTQRLENPMHNGRIEIVLLAGR